jgi:hypothetical protein
VSIGGPKFGRSTTSRTRAAITGARPGDLHVPFDRGAYRAATPDGTRAWRPLDGARPTGVQRGAGLPGASGTRLPFGQCIHDPSGAQRHHPARIAAPTFVLRPPVLRLPGLDTASREPARLRGYLFGAATPGAPPVGAAAFLGRSNSGKFISLRTATHRDPSRALQGLLIHTLMSAPLPCNDNNFP